MYMYQLAACLATQVTAWLRSIMTTHSIMCYGVDMRTSYILRPHQFCRYRVIKSWLVCAAHVPLVLDSICWSGRGVARLRMNGDHNLGCDERPGTARHS